MKDSLNVLFGSSAISGFSTCNVRVWIPTMLESSDDTLTILSGASKEKGVEDSVI